jgi:multidrug efflux system outer membrane protein
MKALLAITLALLLTGCPVGPDYKAPEIHEPESFRVDVPVEKGASLADLPWWQVFEDAELQKLVNQAISQNLDLRAAAARVEQSRAIVGVARSELLPQVGYSGDFSRQRAPLYPGGDPLTYNLFTGAFNLAWEIDLWGRIRRSSEAAEAQFWAAEEAQRGVLLTLVSGVAEAYFQILKLDREKIIAEETVLAFQKSLDLFQQRYEGGVGSELAVARAEAALADVASLVPSLDAQIRIAENTLNVLLGNNPGEIERGKPLAEQKIVPEVPAGIPSELLKRRPDLKQAEDRMISANASVGVAVANFFPRIGLSSLYGSASRDLSDMLNGTPGIWNIAAALSGPIFTGGLNYRQYQAQVAAWEAEVAIYEQSVLEAFAEISNLLTVQYNLRAQRAQRERAVLALQNAVDLSLLRYEIGLANYFEVIDAQQQLFPAQINLARTRTQQLTVLAQLYRGLGGGWELKTTEDWALPTPTPSATPSPASPEAAGPQATP